MEPSFEDRDAFRFIDTIVTRAMKTRQQSCSKWRKGKVGKDGAENKSGTVCNDAVTREQFQLGIVRCHARRILVYIKTNCCSLRWHGQTPHRSNGCPPLAGLPLAVHPPPSTPVAKDFAVGIDVLWGRNAPKSERMDHNNVMFQPFRMYPPMRIIIV